ncbi:SMP-30/gluconolactonase/LRE family protein [Bradyrhizobium cenepequi]|uniref:SMP-30/gluconolactonase/LRE family protein n=1 Tax=Bradyrhizobium cenepequi TaxID=2821403 RepID=UPI001CE26191|nr:SMP-30/gluconolactonase/LRE family protein [Bradyrhizobium cenepequi]MCA6111245.1 SMP-30/gluconolactonase/LRE family protein [Bradyrhizobium cenepequi]
MKSAIVHDPRFSSLIVDHAQLEQLASGCRWAEGPAYFPAGRYLVWSDIPNNRMMRFDETDGSVSVFRAASNNSNGNATDREGRLVTCEHLTRRITRTEHDGSVTVFADRFEGKRLNSPNDVVVKSDGSVWFTDPTYGIDSEYEGDLAESEIGASNVYRIDPGSGAVTEVVRDRVRPNGLAFSPDEKTLYVGDTGASHVPGLPITITAYCVSPDGASVSEPRAFTRCSEGAFDGFRVDERGNLWTSAGRNVFCYASDGTHIGTIPLEEIVANVCFGGPKRNRLYICAQTSLYALYVKTRGASVIGRTLDWNRPADV